LASSTTLTSADPSTTRMFTVTDGSIRKNGSGYSALICFTSKLKHSLSGSLPRHNTIFQAKSLAILAALDWIVSTSLSKLRNLFRLQIRTCCFYSIRVH
jgi:hypothetical protein